MPSFKLTSAVLATAVFSFATAQYSIDPNSVPFATRQSWCQSQTTSCPLLCLQNAVNSTSVTTNTCDPNTLDYSCICGNGLAPNAANYSQTIPYFECQQYVTQCVTACDGNNDCQGACAADNPCGASNPTRINITTTTAGSSSTSAPAGASTGPGGVVYSGLGGSSGATNTATAKSGAQAALNFGHSYGIFAVVGGLFAGFALVL